MSKPSSTLSDIATMIVGAVTICSDPSGLTAADKGLGVLAALKSALAAGDKRHKDLHRMILEGLTSDIEKCHKPQDGEVLLLQMLEKGLPSRDDLAQSGLNADQVVQGMLGRLTDPEHKTEPMKTFFIKVVTPQFEILLADKTFVDDLSPAINKAILATQQEIAQVLQALKDQNGTLAKALDDLQRLRRKDLEALANRFGETEPFNLSDAELMRFLEDMATNFRHHQERINCIDARDGRLANMKAAAKVAAENLDFSEVEDLLSHIDIVETDIACETKILRGENALLSGDVKRAYDCFLASSIVWVSVDKNKSAQVAVTNGNKMWRHGQRYGGRALAYGIRMLREVLEICKDEMAALTWASFQGSLGNYLDSFAARQPGQAGIEYILEAIASFKNALSVFTIDEHPKNWALSQNNLANLLVEYARRSPGGTGTAILADATAAITSALSVYNRSEHPSEWAMAQNNLGNVLFERAVRTSGDEQFEFFIQAANAHILSLEAYSPEKEPERWASAQCNLGAVLANQAERTQGDARIELAEHAITAFRAAQGVKEKDQYPLDWASIQNNLGNIISSLANWSRLEDRSALFGEAVECFESILDVFSLNEHPLEWAKTQNNLGVVLASKAEHSGRSIDPESLNLALVAFQRAQMIWTKEDHALDWAMVERNLARLFVCRSNLEMQNDVDPVPSLTNALSHTDAALSVFDPVNTAYDYEQASKLRNEIIKFLE